MTLWQAAALAAIGAAALVFGVRRRDNGRWFTAVAVAGALTLLAALTYILLALVFLGAVE